MNELMELTWAVLAVLGLLGVWWVLFGRMLTPAGQIGAPVFVVVRGEGAGEGLEQTFHALLWLRAWGLGACPLLLVDAGLNEEGRAAARLLLRRWPEIELCGPEDAAQYWN